MSLFTKDTFTDAAGTLLESHVGESGATWVKNAAFSGGSAAITAAGRLRGNASGFTAYCASGAPGSTVQDIDADLYIASLPASDSVGLLLAEDPSAATYFLAFINNGLPNTQVTLYEVFNGGTAGASSTVQVGAFSVGSTHKLKFGWRPGLVFLLFDGVEVVSLATTTITAPGHAGVSFGQSDTDSTGYHLDNFVASTVQTPTAVTDNRVFFSPYNWNSDGTGAMQSNNVRPSSTFARTSNPGAYQKLAVTAVDGGNATLVLDTSMLTGISAANTPVLSVSVDGLAWQNFTVAYNAHPFRVGLARGLSAGNHTILTQFRSVDLTTANSMGDRWNAPATAPASVVKVTGVEVDGAGSALIAPTVATDNLLIFGDSNLEGADAAGSSLTNTSNDATLSWAAFMPNTEVGIIGLSGQGLASSFNYGNVPKVVDLATPSNSTWDKYYAGLSRLNAGSLEPTPTAIIVALGENDQAQTGATVTAQVQGLVPLLRAAADDNAPILFSIPNGGTQRAAITQGIANAADALTRISDPGAAFALTVATGGVNTNDAIHLNQRGHTARAAQISADLTEPWPMPPSIVLTQTPSGVTITAINGPASANLTLYKNGSPVATVSNVSAYPATSFATQTNPASGTTDTYYATATSTTTGLTSGQSNTLSASFPAAPTINQTTAYAYARDGAGNFVSGRRFYARLATSNTGADVWSNSQRQSSVSDTSGLMTLTVEVGASYQYSTDGIGWSNASQAGINQHVGELIGSF